VNEVETAPGEVDLCKVVNETIETLACDANVIAGTEHCPKAFADPDHVIRILQNYVRNAMIYGKPPFEIEVVGGIHSVTVYVRDRGVGVPEAFVSKLFEKFARADKKKSKAVHGTGLGLSIVRGLARTNGGEAWYEDRDGGGATFAVRLPIAAVPDRAFQLEGTA
jgi:signal transduction histidine kinase